MRDSSSIEDVSLRRYYESLTDEQRQAKRARIIKLWGEAETRIGKYINLDEDQIFNLMTVPDDLLEEYVRSEHGKR